MEKPSMLDNLSDSSVGKGESGTHTDSSARGTSQDSVEQEAPALQRLEVSVTCGDSSTELLASPGPQPCNGSEKAKPSSILVPSTGVQLPTPSLPFASLPAESQSFGSENCPTRIPKRKKTKKTTNRETRKRGSLP